jgi:hypothetical protein
MSVAEPSPDLLLGTTGDPLFLVEKGSDRPRGSEESSRR